MTWGRRHLCRLDSWSATRGRFSVNVAIRNVHRRRNIRYQAADATLANLVALIQQKIGHLYDPLLRMVDMLLIHLTHHLQVLITFAPGRVVVSRDISRLRVSLSPIFWIPALQNPAASPNLQSCAGIGPSASRRRSGLYAQGRGE